ncbi:MAG TPA: HNH endonuclease [Candidatus Acidoferrum sp.]
MKVKPINAALVWKQMEDLLAPQLGFTLAERAVYSHLVRHSRLEGKRQLQFSLTALAGGVGLSRQAVRNAVRRLIARRVLHLVERNCRAKHVVRVRLPLEVKAVRAAKAAARRTVARRAVVNIEKWDFLARRALRRAIHERERSQCFYCLRWTNFRRRCLDHVVPHGKLGSNTYRNIVSCCLDCNSNKSERHAVEFVRSLYRERKLSGGELRGRLRALQMLAAGKLKPPLPGRA